MTFSIVNNDYSFTRLCAALAGPPSLPFAENLRRFIGTANCRLTSCGFAAIQMTLKTMMSLRPGRNEVIIPAYTAPGLVLPVHKLGLTVRLCDIASDTFLLDPAKLSVVAGDRTLAVIAPHMFGLPAAIAAIRDAAGPGIFVIEDCAQSLGTELDGKRVSAAADAVVGSFARGKNFSLYHGGFLSIPDAALQDAAERCCGALASRPAAVQLQDFLKYGLFSFVTHPFVYSFLQKPLGSCKSRKERDDFALAAFDTRLDRAASSLFDLWRSSYEKRITNGEHFLKTFAPLRGIRIPVIPPAARIAFNRLPLLIEDRALIEPLLRRLLDNGIEGSIMYGKPVHGSYSLGYTAGQFPAAEHLAQHLLTLPAHGQIGTADISRAADIISTVMEKRS